MELLELLGIASIIGMIVSSTFIGLFRLSFGSTADMTPKEKVSYRWWGPSVLNKELAKKAMPAQQFNKYWFFVQIQKYSVLGVVFYIFLGLLLHGR